MEDLTPLGMWLQQDGCCIGPSWVAMEFNSLGFLSLRRGWKSFALAQGLRDGYVLHFKFYGATTLFVKVFGRAYGCLDYCMEDNCGGSSGPFGTDNSGNSSSSNSGEGDSDSDGSQGSYVKEEANPD
ncbi:hypothetical protein D1007_27797 [Hordeum vulgare]|nr:hypothetical protein D1007_27797 [Hordeum vulgare]